ncbi:MAG: CYTH domain-containing protein [Clostridia bacterium]|nr:CYTH domain-containing protein [Clostridia bacterium]
MKTEFEVRLLECDYKNIITRLKELNATFTGDNLQMRYCYDFNPVKENSWIRLRTNGKITTLTIKEIMDKSVSGTKESEIVVSSFEETDKILNKLGYFARSIQENRRVQYILDGVEIDIDFWPEIPPYLEIEGESEDSIKKVVEKLGLDYEKFVTLDVSSVYDYYGKPLGNANLKLEEEKKNLKLM